MDDSSQIKKLWQADQPQSNIPNQPPLSTPVAGKESEAAEISQAEALLKKAQQQESAPGTETPEVLSGRELIEDLIEVRLPPEEETVEIPPEMVSLGVQAVPPVTPPIVSDDDDDQALVTLPLTESEIEEGLHHKVRDSIRWLAEWCQRMVKMAHGKIRYAQR